MEVVSEKSTNRRIAREYKKLLKISYQDLNENDVELIRNALDVAIDAHKDQYRKSGEPYIFHPLAVAKIAAEKIGLDSIGIASALLHDVVEDSKYSIEDIESKFGETIAKIVSGLTKISKLKKDIILSIQAENFRKMLLTLNDDVRVILIKIADRLHNMQTMNYMPSEKQTKISSESLYIYAPIAHRIGLYEIKSELEDLSLKYIEPEVYEEIDEELKKSKLDQNLYIRNFSRKISEKLRSQGISFIINGRGKSIYSIRNKMLKKNISIDEVYDRFAIRIIYDSDKKNEKLLAWKIYSIVTDVYRPNPARLRDWISNPKTNGYEALHTTVVGPKKKWIEVQIRSERMHEIAERGYAAHFKYKEGESNESGIEEWLNRLNEVMENQESNAVDFVDDFKLNLYSDEIFVFTPEGDLVSLSKGATALDFAFAVHTGLGLKTRGTKVNGKIVPLNFVLKSGDQVQVIKSNNSKPTANWLKYVVTSRAKSKIRAALKENKKIIAEEGKEILKRKLKQLKFSFNDNIINKLQVFFNLRTTQDLFYGVGVGNIDNLELKRFAKAQNNRIIKFFRRSNKDKKIEEKISFDQLVFGQDEEKLNYKLPKCCKPIPGDNVFGFLTISEGITVHKYSCKNAISMQSKFAYRVVKAKWIDSLNHEYSSTIEILGIDNHGLLNKITKIISENLNLNMKKSVFTTEGDTFKGEITLTVKHIRILNELIDKLKKIPGVDKVVRF
ncbi:MAG: bifunctional (p)ppGpp synthetase/guanosine-3',5'-bis(diphosphate) 3'-pyrophosphohydrolase [Flavobacteriaceae bacterium]|nr:bifunctional (p)ppGpp synthetase/guanosine-3',5'-bis(diphosphate) 3'-pyrophosphohydrolase [Flavobacteriaceae bacterium]MBL6680570.1 bifunctional (p)ppGpp synthetase/guanosine-3',5'-bis(diphosphate) 3'-pyrophosphohydrolase [Flavobacteriaceae bacterium]